MDDNRPTKQWFYQDQGEVMEGLGYQCVPANPEHWYIPHFGSVHQDCLYSTRREAREAAIKWVEMKLNTYKTKLEKLLSE